MWWKGQYMTWLDCIKAVFVLVSNHFRKCFFVNAGVWLHMENKFSGNYFQLTGCFEGFDPKMVWSENFHFKPFLDSRTKRERERERERAFNFADLQTHWSMNWSRLQLRRLCRSRLQLCRSTNPQTNLWPRAFDPRAFDFVGDLEPSCHEPISLSVWFWFSVWFWSTHEPLISDFFCCCYGGVGGGVLVVFLLCGWWWKIAFSECYQTHKNIF